MNNPKIILAPMAGVTDWPFRLLCTEQGADLVFTEMISAQGFLTAPASANAYRFLADIYPGETNVRVQVFGDEPEYVALAARHLMDTGRFCGVDINMGCPARKITGGGSGSALMKAPHIAASIMRATRRMIDGSLSVKFRLGWEHFTALSFAYIAQEEGIDFVTVHGRTREQMYSGKADWQSIARIKQALHIPVYANGDVFTAKDAEAALQTTGCDGVMIGRGALGNPWIFSQTKAFLSKEEYRSPSPTEVVQTALRHADMMSKWKGEKFAVVEMRKHFSWYLKGMRGAARAREQLNKETDLSFVKERLLAFAWEVEQHEKEAALQVEA